jgi:hypothetical protein
LAVEQGNVLGAIMELGVWRGGVMLYAAAVLREMREQMLLQNQHLPPTRDLYLFDAFPAVGRYDETKSYSSVSQQEVEEAFDRFDLRNNPEIGVNHSANSNIYFIKGSVD